MKTPPRTCENCLDEFDEALDELQQFARRAHNSDLSESQSRELILSFEKTHELALSVLEKYFEKQGKGPFSGSRDLTAEAFYADLIDDGKAWLDIVIDRIQYNPVYPMDTKQHFIPNILKNYLSLFERFSDNMHKKLDD